MESSDVKRLGLIFAVQAEIEGMKVLNIERVSQNKSIAYNEESFFDKSTELRNIINCHDWELSRK